MEWWDHRSAAASLKPQRSWPRLCFSSPPVRRLAGVPQGQRLLPGNLSCGQDGARSGVEGRGGGGWAAERWWWCVFCSVIEATMGGKGRARPRECPRVSPPA